MQDGAELSKELVTWYETQVRPFLKEFQPDRLPDLDRSHKSLDLARIAVHGDLAVCFLGSAGVGKSTLINVLVAGAETIVPSGGVGPLTAQALTLRYGQEPRFEVEYHTPEILNQSIFALEQGNKKELAQMSESQDASAWKPEAIADPKALTGTDEPKLSEQEARRKDYRNTARLLVTGDQHTNAELPYLVDSLQEAMGKPRKSGTVARDSHRERIKRIGAALTRGKNKEVYEREGSVTDVSFIRELRDHASGFMAPLIKDLTVFWDCKLLEGGVILVDLPGVGIAGDRHVEVTREWIRKKAQAVVLVVDNRGVTEAVVLMLRKSEFLNRLLFSADDPTDDPVLIVAVVKVDDVAEEEWRQNREQNPGRQKPEHFAEVCKKFKGLIQEQIRSQLEAKCSSGDNTGDGRRQVMENILDTLQVHPLSAIQYRKILADDEEDRAFLTDIEQTNVPLLSESLKTLARQQREARFALI